MKWAIESKMKNGKQNRQLRIVVTILAISFCAGIASQPVSAQAPSNSQPSNPPKPGSQQGANPFPEDTNSVPVLPSTNTGGAPAPDSSAPDSGSESAVPLPGGDGDPVRSPDDASPSTEGSSASSSSAGMDNLLKPPPDTDQDSKHRKLNVPDEAHTESAAEDETVGNYYLDQKNWRAALSRFESALVLDPENPDVYWGLAESQRHTGDYASAKANYLKVTEYDPDSKHGKEAKKILKDPEVANAKAVSANAPASQQPH